MMPPEYLEKERHNFWNPHQSAVADEHRTPRLQAGVFERLLDRILRAAVIVLPYP